MLSSIFLFGFSSALLALLGWWLSGPVLAVSLALAYALLAALTMAWRIHRLERWLAGPDLLRDVPWRGVWLEIAQRLQRLLKQRDKQVDDHKNRLND